MFTLAGLVGGALAGAILGAASMLIPGLAVLGWVGLAILALGLLIELAGHPFPILNRDKETPRAWIEQGWVLWGIKNGAALSLGVTTRLGFPVWYAIPAICLASSSPTTGALVWGVYGALRTGASVATGLFAPMTDRLGGRGYAERILDLRYSSRFLSTLVGATICWIVVVAIA